MLERLTLLLKRYPHLSLHVVPGTRNVHFILCGMLQNSKWVSSNLIEPTRKDEVGIHAVDLTPIRLRWVEEFEAEPLRVNKECDRDTAHRLVEDGGSWLDESFKGKPFYVLFGEAPQHKQRVQESELLFRDLFEVTSTSQTDRHGLPLKFTENQLIPNFSELAMVGFVKIDVSGLLDTNQSLSLGNSRADSPYEFMMKWRKSFHENNNAAIDIYPLDASYEGDEFISDQNILWSERLDAKGVDKEERIPVGWIGRGSSVLWGVGAPEFQIERMTTAVVGTTQQGKSVVAYHLLARYLDLKLPQRTLNSDLDSNGAPFTVVVWNCKPGKEDPQAPDDVPRHPKALTAFKAVIGSIAKPVIARRPLELEKAFESYGAGLAYYTELDLNDKAAVAVCERLGQAIGGRFVFCFDEILNNPEDADLDNYIKRINDFGATPNTYAMVVHQRLSDLNKRWPWLLQESCVFLKALNRKEDFGSYADVCKGRDWSLGDKFDPFNGVEKTEAAVLKPYRKSITEEPILFSLPEYNIPKADPSVISWDIEHPELLRLA